MSRKGRVMPLKGQRSDRKIVRRNSMVMILVCLLALLTAVLIVHMKQLTDKIDPQPVLRIYPSD